MRHYLFLTFAFASFPVFAQAQNYISPPNYNDASIVVNMDVLSNAPVNRAVARPPVPRAPMPIVAPVPVAPIMSYEKAMEMAPLQPTPSNVPPLVMAPKGDALPPPIMDTPQNTQMASLTPVMPQAPIAQTDDFEAYRILFDNQSDELKPSEIAVLNKIIGKMGANPALRLQVHAYANGTPETASTARRLSLTRALKIRDYLTQKNIVATRLDIRALGRGSAEMGDEVGRNKAPADRVDVIFVR